MNDTTADYLSGFFDAEGNVYLKRYGGSKPRHTLRLTVASTDQRPLELFRAAFGGHIGTYKTKSDKHKVCLWWQFHCGRNAVPVSSLRSRTVIKERVLSLAEQFCATIKVPGARNKLRPTEEERRAWLVSKEDLAQRELLRRAISSENECGHQHGASEVVSLSPAYCAGLFDGDGTVTLRRQSRGRTFQLVVEIAAINCRVLSLLVSQFGGRVHGPYANRRTRTWAALCGRAQRFLEVVEPHLIVKRERAREALKIRRLNALPRTQVARGNGEGFWQKSDRVVDEMLAIKASLIRMNRLGAVTQG